MSLLKKPYEISIWKDTWDSNTKKFTESKIMIIGSDQMTNASRALEPKLKRNINGSNELTFKMHRTYIDVLSGQKVENEYIDFIANETKIKLKYEDDWFDFIVKNIAQDSKNYVYTFTATDLHINELSKNGYGVTLDSSLMNNSGTAQELAKKILEVEDIEGDDGPETVSRIGWSVQAEELTQYIEEPLVQMNGPYGLVLVPYSSLKNKPKWFQYFTGHDTEPLDVNKYKQNQGYEIITNANPYTTDTKASQYGFYYPYGWSFVELTDKRGERLVYTHKSEYNPILNKIIYYYKDFDGTVGAIAGFTETEYITPNLIQNLVTNTQFKSISGWIEGYGADDISGADYPVLQGNTHNGKVEISTAIKTKDGYDYETSVIDSFKSGTFNETTKCIPYLKMSFPTENSFVLNTGFYDNRRNIKNLYSKQKFVLLYKQTPEDSKNFTVSLTEAEYKVNKGCYELGETYLTFDSNEAQNYPESTDFSGYKYVIGEIDDNYNLTENQFQNSKMYLIFREASATAATADGDEASPEDTNPPNNLPVYKFLDIQIFPYIADIKQPIEREQEDEPVEYQPIAPSHQVVDAITSTKYYYYKVADNPSTVLLDNNVLTAKDYKFIISDAPLGYEPVYTSEKVRSLNIKQSNYFNAIQSLCEAFECWAEFEIDHDDTGRITEKTVIIHEHVENPNNVGFRYGVNLKESKRTIDSKQVVTKLIVPDNINQNAKNGFCSIARAGANESGEDYIYNFQHYINKRMIDEEQLADILELPGEIDPDDIKNSEAGLYPKLLYCNSRIQDLSSRKIALSKTYDQAHADLQIAQNGRKAAEELFKEAEDSFLKEAGYAYTDIYVPYITNDDLSKEENAKEQAAAEAETTKRQNQISESSSLQKTLCIIAEQRSAYWKYLQAETDAQTEYETYKEKIKNYASQIESIKGIKNDLNINFFKQFYRFIQEGTWKGDDYIDDEKYYIDAVNTSRESGLPKVTYSFSVIDVSPLTGYEDFVFNLGDKTWVEDAEFFGADENNVPIRIEVVITEIEKYLDDPSKNTIKVQNYKNEFDDLFQKQTATVQQVQFAKDAWAKAGNQATASSSQQMQFLQEAFTNSQMVYSNPGEQSVILSEEGLIITDVDTPSRQIRLVGGAILIRDSENGGTDWKVALTSDGINAKLITAGQINTGILQIMNGDEPYFRWDALGLTAYYFNTQDNSKYHYMYGLDTSRGVRFDRFGIYGYNNKDGSVWHPENLQEIYNNSQFALTWDGLFLNLGNATYTSYYDYNSGTKMFKDDSTLLAPIKHTSVAKIGKTNNYIYNSWVTDTGSAVYNQPYYDPDSEAQKFVKVVAIGGDADNQNLVIYDDGTLVAERVKLVGDIEWTTASSPSKSVYGRAGLTSPPAKGTPYSAFDESDAKNADGTKDKPFVWHKIVAKEDVYYCHTDNGGATWEGPFLITGRSTVGTETQYYRGDIGIDPTKIPDEDWSDIFPTNIPRGKSLFTRTRDIYNNGEQSLWRYSAGYFGEDAISIEIISTLGDKIINSAGNGVLYAKITQSGQDIDYTNFKYISTEQPTLEEGETEEEGALWLHVQKTEGDCQFIIKKYTEDGWAEITDSNSNPADANEYYYNANGLQELKYSYTWTFLNQNGEPSTYNGEIEVKQKFLYIDGSVIEKKKQFNLTIEEVNEVNDFTTSTETEQPELEEE